MVGLRSPRFRLEQAEHIGDLSCRRQGGARPGRALRLLLPDRCCRGGAGTAEGPQHVDHRLKMSVAGQAFNQVSLTLFLALRVGDPYSHLPFHPLTLSVPRASVRMTIPSS